MLLGVGSNLLGGVTTDFLSAKLGLRFGRALVGVVSYVVAALTMVMAVVGQEPQRAAMLIAVASASSMFARAAHWAAAIDIGREHASSAPR